MSSQTAQLQPETGIAFSTLPEEPETGHEGKQQRLLEEVVQRGRSQDVSNNTQSVEPKHPTMASIPARLGTYASWHLGKMYPPEKLAEAGLFCLTGDDSRVTCFHSGKTFSISSEKYADPWEEHVHHCHSCPFSLGHRKTETALLQGTSDGTLRTRPGRSQQAATLGISTAVQASEGPSSTRQTTEAVVPTPTTQVSGATRTSNQYAFATASAEDKHNVRKALGTDEVTADKLAVIQNDISPSIPFDVQEAGSTCSSTLDTSQVQSGKDIISNSKKDRSAAEASTVSDQHVFNNIVTKLAADEQVAKHTRTATTRVQGAEAEDGQLRGKEDQRAILANLNKGPGESLLQRLGAAFSSTSASPPNNSCLNCKEKTAIQERAYSNECASEPTNAAKEPEASTVSNTESENNKETMCVYIESATTCAQNTLVSGQDTDVENTQGDKEPDSAANTQTSRDLSIHQPKQNEQSVQELGAGALRGAGQQTGDILFPTSPSSNTGSEKNQQSGDITVSRQDRPNQEVSRQHEAGITTPGLMTTDPFPALLTPNGKRIHCKDFLVSKPNDKGSLPTAKNSQCTEEAVDTAGKVHDKQLGFDHTDVVSTDGKDCTEGDFKLPVQEVGDSNTESSSRIGSAAQIQPQCPSQVTEDTESGDAQVQNIKPMYVDSTGKSWHPEHSLSEGMQDSGSGLVPIECDHRQQPDTSSSTGRQKNASTHKHHEQTSTAQAFNNRQQNAAQDKQHQEYRTAQVFGNRQQHTAQRKHHGETSTTKDPRHRQQKKESAEKTGHQFRDYEEVASQQSLGSVHLDCNHKHTATSHPHACGYAACSCHRQEQSKDDAMPENSGGDTDSEEEDENGDENNNSGGVNYSYGDNDDDGDDDGSDDNNSSSSDDDHDDPVQPYAHGSNIYAGVVIDLREGRLPCLHCHLEEKQVLLPCCHRNLCYLCFFCKSFWRHHLLHGPPRCLLCGEAFTDITDPLLFLWALAFNRRPRRRTNCGCGYRRG